MKDMGAMIYLCFLDNLSAGLVEELHRAGYLVDGSVVNTRERLAEALALRVSRRTPIPRSLHQPRTSSSVFSAKAAFSCATV